MQGGAEGAGRRVVLPAGGRRPEAGGRSPHQVKAPEKSFHTEEKEFYVQPIRRAVPWPAHLSQVAHPFHSIRGFPPSRRSAGSSALEPGPRGGGREG